MANVLSKRIRQVIGVEKLKQRQEEIFGMEREILSALKFNSTIAESHGFCTRAFLLERPRSIMPFYTRFIEC